MVVTVLMKHGHHVCKHVTISFGERDRCLERAICVNYAPTWPILFASHVTWALPIHHIWLLDTTEPRKLSWVVIRPMQRGVDRVLVQLHQIDLTAPAKATTGIAIATAMLSEVHTIDAPALCLAHIHCHPNRLPQQPCRFLTSQHAVAT
jgi:hypothetical protein